VVTSNQYLAISKQKAMDKKTADKLREYKDKKGKRKGVEGLKVHNSPKLSE
jgi:hypothetical protein